MSILSGVHSIADSLGRFIVRCIQDSIGDDVKEDIRRNRLATTNSIPTRIWDLINTKLSENASNHNCSAGKTQRGPWQMILVFDPVTGFLFSIMREERYRQLRKMSPKKRRFHYLTCLAETLNQDYLKEKQTTVFDVIGDMRNENDNENEIVASIVEEIFNDLKLPANIIRNHALILFEASDYEMQSARCIIVDGNLEKIDGCDWNGYIAVKDSNITDKIDNSELIDNNPSQGLKFTKKARERAGMRDSITLKGEEEEKNKDI